MNQRELLDGVVPELRLDKARHIKYWTRCIKTLLPTQYTSNDSNRMYLAFLMVCALDLLGALKSSCNDDERREYVDWIYYCQHPDGGFRMWPGTDFGEHANDDNAKWDPANVPATYFALASLLTLGDDFKRLKRRETLQWLRRMQRRDGSFGETLVSEQIEGGRDPRFGYCATGIRYILRGRREGSLNIDGEEVQDINIDALVDCINIAESYDGGIADEYLHEPHAGYTFCSLGALQFVGRLSTDSSSTTTSGCGPLNPQEVVRWLVYRQTDLLDPDALLDSEFIGLKPLTNATIKPQREGARNQNEPLYQDPSVTVISPLADLDSVTDCAGMNGRTNKVADTCYAWWAGASLHMLGHPNLYDHQAVQKYLITRTQHPVLGGFGKFPGDLPDIYHSCLGLAALSLASGTDVKEFDAGMCVTKDAKARLEGLWAAWGL